MSIALILIILAVLLGFYVSWNIGANDVANAVGTAVGSGALTLTGAVIIAAIFEFSGAFLLGSNVSSTVESGIVDPAVFAGAPLDYVYGMLASLLAAGVWLQIASYFGWPVSTTHSIVGAVLGFGVVLGGFDAIYWDRIGSITASWVISPLLGGGLGYFIFSLLRWKIFYHRHPVRAAKRLTPFLVFAIFSLLPTIILYNGLHHLPFELSFPVTVTCTIAVALLLAFVSAWVVNRIPLLKDQDSEQLSPALIAALVKVNKHLSRAEAASTGDLHEEIRRLQQGVNSLNVSVEAKKAFELGNVEHRTVEKIFGTFQIITACFLAFAHGANDVANGIGPLSAVIKVIQAGSLEVSKTIPIWALLLGGVGIVVGLATWGWRVIETVGRKITELTPSRGFSAELGAATTIVLASKLGIPISTTHTLVGAVLGVGFARGIGALNLNIVRDIALSWVITLPAGAVLSVAFFYALRTLF